MINVLLTRLSSDSKIPTAIERLDLLLPADERTASSAAVAHLAESSLVALLAGDVTRRNPVGAVPGLKAFDAVHHVDVFEGEGAGFVEEEVDDQAGDGVCGEEDEAVGVGDAICGEGGEETDEDYEC